MHCEASARFAAIALSIVESRGAAIGASGLIFFSGLGCTAGAAGSVETDGGCTGFSAGAGVGTGTVVGADVVVAETGAEAVVETGAEAAPEDDPAGSIAVALGAGETAGTPLTADAEGKGADAAIFGAMTTGVFGLAVALLDKA